MKKESMDMAQSPHFQSSSGMLNYYDGTYSLCGMMEQPRIPFYGMESWDIARLRT